MQQIHIIGNIGNDAKIQTTNGKEFVTFSACVTDTYKDKDGVKIDRSTWYNVLTNKTALAKFLVKGTKVFVQGDLRAKTYPNAKNEIQIDLTINANRIELLTPKPKENE